MKDTLKALGILAVLALLCALGARAAVYQTTYGGNALTGISTNALGTNGTCLVDTIMDGGTIERMVVTTSFGITNATLLLINVDDKSTAFTTNWAAGSAGTNAATTFTMNFTNTVNLLHGGLEIFSSNVLAAAYSNGIFVSSAVTTSTTVNITLKILEIR